MNPAPFINRKLVDAARRDDALIVFPHAQRTGGKALRDQVLGAAYGAERIYSASRGTGAKNWQDVSAAELAPFRVFTGPSNFADLDKGRTNIFVGLLRHPLYRAVSLYFYCRKHAHHTLNEIATRCSLQDFYAEASRVQPAYFRNTQCLRLCGSANAEKARAVIAAKYLGIGFTADVDAFGNALGAVLGWPPVHLNPAPDDTARYDALVTPKFRDRVLRESGEDLALYEGMASGLWPGIPRRSPFPALAAVFGRSRFKRI